MKTVAEQRDDALALLLEVFTELADASVSFTGQTFVHKARAMHRFGNHESAITHLKIAKSYLLPEKATV